MSTHDVLARIHAQVAGVDVGRTIRHQLHPDELAAVRTAAEQVRQLPIYIATSHDVTTAQDVVAYLRRITREHGTLALAVVDYLQLLTSGERGENRQVEVAGFSRALKLAAGQLNTPIIALSQLRRRELAGPPAVSDLRESGALEQDADLVVLMWREDDQPSILHVEVGKSRNGRLGRLTLDWEGHHSRVLTRWARSEPWTLGPRS
jgi:replicative DNA helicase